MGGNYPNLLSPIELGPLSLRHRVVMCGHTMLLGDGSRGSGEPPWGYEPTIDNPTVAPFGPVHPATPRSIDVGLIYSRE